VGLVFLFCMVLIVLMSSCEGCERKRASEEANKQQENKTVYYDLSGFGYFIHMPVPDTSRYGVPDIRQMETGEVIVSVPSAGFNVVISDVSGTLDEIFQERVFAFSSALIVDTVKRDSNYIIYRIVSPQDSSLITYRFLIRYPSERGSYFIEDDFQIGGHHTIENENKVQEIVNFITEGLKQCCPKNV